MQLVENKTKNYGLNVMFYRSFILKLSYCYFANCFDKVKNNELFPKFLPIFSMFSVKRFSDFPPCIARNVKTCRQTINVPQILSLGLSEDIFGDSVDNVSKKLIFENEIWRTVLMILIILRLHQNFQYTTKKNHH